MTWLANRQHWLGIGLVASLALNAFFLGAAATDVFRVKKRGDHDDGRLRYEVRWLAGRLSPEAMASVQDAIAAARPDTQRHLDRLRELRSGLGELAAAAQPDRAAIDTRLGEIRVELDRMAGDTQKTTMDALLTLPPDARAKLAGK